MVEKPADHQLAFKIVRVERAKSPDDLGEFLFRLRKRLDLGFKTAFKQVDDLVQGLGLVGVVHRSSLQRESSGGAEAREFCAGTAVVRVDGADQAGVERARDMADLDRVARIGDGNTD